MEICFVLNLCLRSKDKFLLNLLNETVKFTPKHFGRNDMLQVNKKMTKSTKPSMSITHGTMRGAKKPLKQKEPLKGIS